jgi:hypothetical protein
MGKKILKVRLNQPIYLERRIFGGRDRLNQEPTLAVTPMLTKTRKPDLGLRTAPAPMRDLSTIAFFRPGALLRRNGPVPGILAAHRSGAIMDKSGRPRVAISHPQNPQKLSS